VHRDNVGVSGCACTGPGRHKTVEKVEKICAGNPLSVVQNAESSVCAAWGTTCAWSYIHNLKSMPVQALQHFAVGGHNVFVVGAKINDAAQDRFRKQ
jgi:hypothetical protein